MSQSPASADGWLPYAILDVFTERPFSGNPLAVVSGAENLDLAQMQAVARQFNLSETAFPMPVSDAERAAGAHYRLRIFTPEVEIPFAGHPSVGSAWWLAASGQIPLGPVGQLCGAGLLPVDVTSSGATLTAGPASVSDPIAPDEALAAVGLTHGDLASGDVRIASTGLPFAVLVVAQDALGRCSPDLALLRRHFSHPQPATGVYVVAWDAPAKHARARMFAGDIGSPEDPATGSAALALGALLAARGDLGDDGGRFTVDQGVEMGRPSQLTVSCEMESGRLVRLQVTGSAVLVAEGRIAVPPGNESVQ